MILEVGFVLGIVKFWLEFDFCSKWIFCDMTSLPFRDGFGVLAI